MPTLVPTLVSPSLRLRRAVALAALLAVALLLLMPGLGAGPDRWRGALWDLCHLPGFLLVTLCLATLLPERLARRQRVLLAFGGALALAVASEIAQGWVGRKPSLGDVALDAAGAGLAALWLAWHPSWQARRIAAVGLVASAGVALAFWPPLSLTVAEARHRAHFPDIGTFGEASGRRVWRAQGNATVDWVEGIDGGTALRLRLGPGYYGGVSYRPGVQDWSGRPALHLELANLGEPFLLGLRLDDAETGRVDGRGWHSAAVEVKPGRRSYEIPLGPANRDEDSRGIDLTRVVRLALFAGAEKERREFLIHSAFLK